MKLPIRKYFMEILMNFDVDDDGLMGNGYFVCVCCYCCSLLLLCMDAVYGIYDAVYGIRDCSIKCL